MIYDTDGIWVGFSWEAAREACLNEDAYQPDLASIHSREENGMGPAQEINLTYCHIVLICMVCPLSTPVSTPPNASHDMEVNNNIASHCYIDYI